MTRIAAVLRALAGAQGTRGNAYLFEFAGSSLLMDVGESVDRDWLSKLESEPDLTVISHVHADHVGALGSFRERFPTARVIATATTARLVASALAPQVGESRASAISDTIEAVEFHQPVEWGGGIVRLHPAGHMPGASMTVLEIDGRRLVYTGDFSYGSRAGTGSLDVEFERPDFLLMEGALAGVRRLEGWKVEPAIAELREWLGESGPRLVVVEGLGLGPEMTSIFSDALVHESVETRAGMVADLARCSAALRDGGLVVAAGSDLSLDSAAGRLADEVLGESGARIALFNSLRPGTRAQRISTTGHRARILGIPGEPRLKARVRRFDWPLHATATELLDFVDEVRPARILLTHGREEALFHLRRTLQKRIEGRVDVLGDDVPEVLWTNSD